MGTVTVIAVLVGIICGLMFAVGFVMNSIVKSNQIGDTKGDNMDFMVYNSQHIYTKAQGHRQL